MFAPILTYLLPLAQIIYAGPCGSRGFSLGSGKIAFLRVLRRRQPKRSKPVDIFFSWLGAFLPNSGGCQNILSKTAIPSSQMGFVCLLSVIAESWLNYAQQKNPRKHDCFIPHSHMLKSPAACSKHLMYIFRKDVTHLVGMHSFFHKQTSKEKSYRKSLTSITCKDN